MNPNYRFGYVQIRNLDIQQQIRPTVLLNIDYTGTKGTNLDILEAPNRTISASKGFRSGFRTCRRSPLRTLLGDSEANAGSIRLRKRLANGFSVGGLYTYSKSIDDASSIGGGATPDRAEPAWEPAGRALQVEVRPRRRAAAPTAWPRILLIFPRNVGSPASTRRRDSPPIICGSCPSATTNAGSPGILRCAQSLATGNGAAIGPSRLDFRSPLDLWETPARLMAARMARCGPTLCPDSPFSCRIPRSATGSTGQLLSLRQPGSMATPGAIALLARAARF